MLFKIVKNFQHVSRMLRSNIASIMFSDDRYLSTEPFSKRRSTSSASINELVGEEEDHSFERTGEIVRLTKCDDEDFITNAYRYCKRSLRGNWATCPPEKFTVNYVSGGLTNYLYLCSLPEDVKLHENEPRKVLIRIYGDIVDQKQRFYEGVVFTLLSERGFGPKNYGVFYSGRIEEFIPHRHLYTSELSVPDISALISQTVARYHCMHLPLNKDPVYLWESIEKYLMMCQNISFDDPENQKIYEQMRAGFDFDEEYDWLRQMLLNLNAPVLFCHNDVHEGNILHIKKGTKTKVMMIDYDYSSYNYRGYDIGNHFCEWIYEYNEDLPDGYSIRENGFPSHEQQLHFAKNYIDTATKLKKNYESGLLDPQKDRCTFEVCSPEELLYEVNRFALASHLLWGLWSVLQGQVSKKDFNYLKYAQARIDAYKEQKAKLGYTTTTATTVENVLDEAKDLKI